MNLAVFDIDGTVTDTNRLDSDCFAEAVRSVLQRDIPTDWSAYEHVTDSGIIASLGASTEETQRIRETFFALLREREMREIEGAARLLAALRAKGDWRVAYATGGWEPSARMKLAGAGLPLDLPLASADDAVSRREIVEIAIERAREQYRCEFDRIIILGDGAWDRKCAEEMRLPFVGEIDWRDTRSAIDHIEATIRSASAASA